MGISSFVILASLLLPACRHQSPAVNHLHAAADRAERVIIVDNRTTDARLVTDTATTRELRRALAAAVADQPLQHQGFTCLCFANLVVAWVADDRRLVAAGLQPDLSLSLPDSPVTGDLELDPATAAHLHALLEAAFAGARPLPRKQIPPLD